MKPTSPNADDVERALDPHYHLWDAHADVAASITSPLLTFCGLRVSRDRMVVFAVNIDWYSAVTCPRCLTK